MNEMTPTLLLSTHESFLVSSETESPMRFTQIVVLLVFEFFNSRKARVWLLLLRKPSFFGRGFVALDPTDLTSHIVRKSLRCRTAKHPISRRSQIREVNSDKCMRHDAVEKGVVSARQLGLFRKVVSTWEIGPPDSARFPINMHIGPSGNYCSFYVIGVVYVANFASFAIWSNRERSTNSHPYGFD